MHFNKYALGEGSSKQYYFKKKKTANSLDIPSMGKDYFLKTNSFFLPENGPNFYPSQSSKSRVALL